MRAIRRFGTLLAALVVVGACSNGTAAVPSGPPVSKADFDFVNRLTWGATPADLAEYKRLGRAAWLDRQLAPKPRPLPADVAARFAAMPLAERPLGAVLVELEAQRKAATHAATVAEKQSAYALYRNAWAALKVQAIDRSLTRDLTSPDQLREQLTWFWFNQFNIRGDANNLAVLVNDYEENAIRAHATGKYCDLVNATLRHPAMMLYLNNAANYAGHINENYARELMELHTLGVGGGYTQQDVQSLAKVLTGASADLSHWPAPRPAGGISDGLFVFDPSRHDNGAKTLLGHRLKAKGFAEIEEATAILCAHPSTAKRVATRLAEYFVADVPPPALIDAMAATYRTTGGDIAAIMRTMIASPEFAASLGQLYKDPQHFVLSALRLSLTGAPRDATAANVMLASLGEGRFARVTPDGYPLTSDNWNASGQLSTRFGIAARIGRSGEMLLYGPVTRLLPATPPDLKAQQAAGLYAALSPATTQVLGEAKDQAEWNSLFLSSPEFMRR